MQFCINSQTLNKGTVQWDFLPPFLYIIRVCLGHWPMGYLILVKISRGYSNFKFKKSDSPGYDTLGRLTRRDIILREDQTRWVWYPGEIDPPGMIPRGDWLAGYDTLGRLTRRVWYPGEIDLSKYHIRGDWQISIWITLRMTRELYGLQNYLALC